MMHENRGGGSAVPVRSVIAGLLAVSMMLATIAAGALTAPYAAYADNGASPSGTPGLCTPTVGTMGDSSSDINASDTGVATYVGGDMIVGKRTDANTMRNGDGANGGGPDGSYAAEIEGATVVNGDLYAKPRKGFFTAGVVAFGSQFVPAQSAQVLTVGGNTSTTAKPSSGSHAFAWKDSESPNLSDTSRSVVGISDNNKLSATGTDTTDYTAAIAGDKYYLYGKADITDQNEKEKYASVVPYSGTSDHAKWNVSNPLKNVAGLDNGADGTTTDPHDFTGYGDYLKTLSTQMKDYNGTSEMTVDTTGTLGNVDPNDSSSTKYTRYKYNWNNGKNEISYKFEFDNKLNEKLITFHGDGKSALQVFTIKASDLTTADGQTGISYKFENIPDNTSVVVNVTGANVRFHNGWRFLWQAPGEDKPTDLSNGYWNPGSNGTAAQKKAYEDYAERASKILWNFADATNVTILGGQASGTMKSQHFVENSSAGWKTSKLETDDDPAAAMMGSILVPNGSLESHVSTNGRVWVGGDFSMYNPTAAHYPGQSYNKFENSAGQTTASVIDMDQERHNLPWSGNYTSQCASLEWTKVDAANPNNTTLAGSSWAIYTTRRDAENGVNPLKLVTDNEPVVDLNGKDGVIKVGGLNPEATYYVKEIGAPSGYAPSGTVYKVTSGKEGSTVTVTQDADGNEVAAGGRIGNTKIGPSVTWKKTDVTGGDTLAGSSWTLTRKGDAATGGATQDESWTVKDNTVKPTMVNVYRGAGGSADLTNPVSDLTMNMGETLDLTTKVLPDAALQKVIWKSDTADYRNILRIDLNDDGTSTAYAVGPGVVDAQVCTVAETGEADPGTQVCKHVTITVSANIANVTDFHVRHGNAEIGDGGTIALRAGKTAQLSVTAKDVDGNAVTPTYESYATNVATVSANGLITAVADGTATIVVKAGNQTRVFAVEVSSADPVQYTYIYFPASGEGVWGSADMWVHYGADGDAAWRDSDHMTAATCDGNWKVARIPRVTAGNVRFGFQRTGDGKAWYGKQGGGDFTFPANAEAVTVSGGSMTAGYPSVACSAVRPTALLGRGRIGVTAAVADAASAGADASAGKVFAGADASVANGSAGAGASDGAGAGVAATRDDVDADAGEFKVIDLADGTYWLKEATAPAGYTLNPTVWQFTVSDGRVASWNGGWADGDTTKKIDANLRPGAGNAISDTPKPVDITLPVKKTVRNTAWPKDSNGGAFVPFTFRISSDDTGAPIPEGCNDENGKSSDQLQCVITVKPAAGSADRTATATFGKLTFDQSALAAAAGDGGDYAKTYTYRVTEVTPPAADRVPNLRYSKAEYKVEVTVKRANTDGVLAGLTATAVITRVTDDSGKTEAGGGVKVGEITIASAGDATSGTTSAATFTNTKVLTGLPATGADWTGRLVVLGGLAFILAGAVFAGGHELSKRRRRSS